MHVRRLDSASNMNNTIEENILAVELRTVRCRVSDKSAPHEKGDLEYDWNYYALGGDMQLSIGLGSVLNSAEVNNDLGMRVDEESTDENRGYALSEDDDDSGLGGF
jgi:hypothetical protein